MDVSSDSVCPVEWCAVLALGGWTSAAAAAADKAPTAAYLSCPMCARSFDPAIVFKSYSADLLKQSLHQHKLHCPYVSAASRRDRTGFQLTAECFTVRSKKDKSGRIISIINNDSSNSAPAEDNIPLADAYKRIKCVLDLAVCNK